jgi:uncharacterized membrane protein
MFFVWFVCFSLLFLLLLGLIQDSAAVVVASMIVSPLMTPILGLTFGALIRDPPLFTTCVRNEVIGVLLTFITGFLIGIVCSFVDVEQGMPRCFFFSSLNYLCGTYVLPLSNSRTLELSNSVCLDRPARGSVAVDLSLRRFLLVLVCARILYRVRLAVANC